MERSLTLLLFLALIGLPSTKAQTNDFGAWYEVGAEKKLSSNWNLGVETQLRTRNNSQTLDRWSMGINAEYKIVKGLKASAGYTFLYDNNIEEFEFKKDGLRPNKWTPSYWGLRHRFNVSLTGSTTFGRLGISLRERWQYTYRPEADEKKYDFDYESWKSVKGKGKNVLRSRLKLEYDIPHWKFDPIAGLEIFNDHNGIQKTRYQIGTEYKYQKRHIYSLTYYLQNTNENDDDGDMNSHILSIGYKYKF